MKSTFRLIRRFVLILMLSLIGLLIVNILLVLVLFGGDESNRGGWTGAKEAADYLTESESGDIMLAEEGQTILKEMQAWAILIEDGTGDVIWHSGELPKEIPLHYSMSDVSWYTRGYIADYPTTTAAWGDDLLVLGHPKDRYWKEMTPTWDYAIIANTPKIILTFFLANLFFVFLIYILATSGILRQIKPIVSGIEALPEGENIYIREKGLLSDLAAAINRVAEKLRVQERELRKKETVRANWIAGVSHDIRTPLSMVMGYAGQLEEDETISVENRRKAGIIRQQSIRMKNLVNDLNLSSKLEYNMQPVRWETFNLIAAVRKVAVDFINADMEGKYPVEWNTVKGLDVCMIEGDKELIQRAVSNIISNSQIHNPEGCKISVEITTGGDKAYICIEDNGIGVTEEKLHELRDRPHYLMSDGSTTEQRHGLGLLIVKQIAGAHQGTVDFGHGRYGGFMVRLTLRRNVNEYSST